MSQESLLIKHDVVSKQKEPWGTVLKRRKKQGNFRVWSAWRRIKKYPQGEKQELEKIQAHFFLISPVFSFHI